MNKYFKLFIAALLSGVGLWFAFKGEELKLMHHLMLVEIIANPACFLLILSCFVRAFRWQLLIRPFGHISLNQFFGATMIGYFGTVYLLLD
ncbi:hypothetical protein Ct9H90mP29_17840 [bacterium]|nr:MAG: hypothetical protein Ct9H90mP29_17840 [bacterium]